jgi:putative transposase
MTFALIDELRADYTVDLLCETLAVSPSGYYAHKDRKPCARAIETEKLLAVIRRIHAEHPAYGSPRVHAQLVTEGHVVSRGRVEKIMADNDIHAITKRRFRVCTTDSKHDLPIAENLLDRNFRAYRPNQKWVADITYIHTDEGWLYLAAIMDLCTRKIVGWAMRDHMRVELTLAALSMAIQRQRPGEGLIHHSDRGSQYADKDYRKMLKDNKITASMSRKGNCWDNAPMESFFHTLKTEDVHHRKFRSKEEAKQALFRYIETYYNSRRLHSGIGYITPAQMELKVA